MSWIWLEGAPRDTDVFVFARRVFTASARDALLRVSADGRYRAWLNGEQVGRGPLRSLPRDLAADAYEVRLREENVLCILARRYGRPTVHWLPGATESGGVWVSLTTGGDEIVASDAAWKVMRAPYTPQPTFWEEGMPGNEVIDGRAWPHGWLDASFDDAAWEPAAVVDGPVPREHPLPPLHERVHEVGTVAAGTTTLDIGFITNAHIEVEMDGGEIALRCGEEVDASGTPLDERAWSLVYTAAGIPRERVEAFEPAGFRFIEARLAGSDEATIRIRERTYPRAPGASFRCSDPALERIWSAGARTLDLCSVDAYIDCPSREQRAWIGDDYINVLVSLVVNPDRRLIEHDLRLHAAGQRADGTLPMVAAADFSQRAHTLPDGNLHWVRTLARLWEHTGDADLLDRMLPVAQRIVDHFETLRGPDGLLTGWRSGVEGWVFVDWAQMERGPSLAVMDALYHLALIDHAVMCDALGWDDDARVARERAERTAKASTRYWDEARGAYVDATKRISQQTNAAAILAGWADDERTARILDRITDDDRLVITKTPGDGGTLGERLAYQFQDPDDFDDEQNVVAAQPYFAHFLHQSFMRAGRADLLGGSIRRWLPMVERSGTVEEYWDAVPGMGSRCHSWAATPTYDLVRHVAGVNIAAGVVTVEPNLGGLAWAEATVPALGGGWMRVRADADGTVTTEQV